MELPSMKMDHQKEDYNRNKSILAAEEDDKEEYPCGLCITLDNETLDMLGFKSLPKVGDNFHLRGFAQVKMVSESNSSDSQKQRSVLLQITNLLVQNSEQSKPSEQVMYGDMPKVNMIE